MGVCLGIVLLNRWLEEAVAEAQRDFLARQSPFLGVRLAIGVHRLSAVGLALHFGSVRGQLVGGEFEKFCLLERFFPQAVRSEQSGHY